VKIDNHDTPVGTSVKFPNAIEFYPDGIRLHGPKKGGLSSTSGKHKRGKISGWSKSSRRRMRDLLMRNRFPENYEPLAVTLTIPGYPLQLSEAAELWKRFRTSVKDEKMLCIWRCEIQKRGQLHWHCIMGAEKELSVPREQHGNRVKALWHDCMRGMGNIEYKYCGSPTDFVECDRVTGSRNLMEWKGVEKYSCHIDYMDDQNTGWKRYLIDHTTKVKQEQIPENIGRHWGCIGKKKFLEVYPESTTALSPSEYFQVTRMINRMFTPFIKDPRAVFGRRRGFTVNRGKSGKTDIFTKSNPTVERVISWVISQRESTSLPLSA